MAFYVPNTTVREKLSDYHKLGVPYVRNALLRGFKTIKAAKQFITTLPTENQIERNAKFKIDYVIDTKVAWDSDCWTSDRFRKTL